MLRDDFENIIFMLNALNAMTCTLFETKVDHSEHSYGIYLLHKLIMAELDAVAVKALEEISAEAMHKLTGREVRKAV